MEMESQITHPSQKISLDSQSSRFFLELQEANNISKAAYKELMTMAVDAQTWVVSTPALGSLEEFLKMFRSPPPSGMRVERSIESAIVPVAPDSLVTIMMNVKNWSMALSHIVLHAFEDAEYGILQQLSRTDEEIKDVLMVYAEFQLPTPYVQTREFHFLRCLREIRPNMWAIVDLSDDYFSHKSDSALGTVCQRRPSGLIVRGHGNYSQVIWIENVLVYEYTLENGMDYGMISSNFPFSAKCWVSALIWKLKRYYSRFINVKMKVDRHVRTSLLDLTDSMKEFFVDMVNEVPDGSKWATLSNQDVKILRNLTIFHHNILSLNDYIVVACFKVQEKPISVFDFLVKKNMELQWPNSLNLEEPEEVIKFALDDDSNCITLHKKVVIWNQSVKNEYLLQEASTDGFCSFVMSAPMTQLDVNAALFFGRGRETLLQPSGFAIMPGGSDGLHSDVSLVTIAMQHHSNISKIDEVIEFLSSFIGVIIEDIQKKVSRECKAAC